MDAELEQLLLDTFTEVQRCAELTAKAVEALSELREQITAGSDTAGIFEALQQLRADLATRESPAPTSTPAYEVVLSDVQYDRNDRIVSARYSRVPKS